MLTRRLSLPTCIYACAICALLLSLAAPALATQVSGGTGNTGTNSFATMGGYFEDFINFMQGPVIKFVGFAAVIGGAVALMRGGEMSQGVHNIAIMAIIIGVIVIGVSIVGNLSTGLVV